jgi:flagellar biosynthesis protein FliQ
MTEDNVINLASQAIDLAINVGGPLLLASLLIGLIVSVFQAVTQIQEQSLSLIPKIVAIVLVLVLLGPWMIDKFVAYTTNLYASIPTIVGS